MEADQVRLTVVGLGVVAARLVGGEGGVGAGEVRLRVVGLGVGAARLVGVEGGVVSGLSSSVVTLLDGRLSLPELSWAVTK